MGLDLLKKKIEAEKDVAPSFGVYRLYSFVMSMINNPKIARILALEYHTKTEVTRAQARYNHYNRNKA